MSLSELSQEFVKISGFKLDRTGLRDRLLLNRYFGLWEDAESAYLMKHSRGNHSGLDLMVKFEGRKRPVRIDSGYGKKDGLKLEKALRFIKRNAPQVELVGDYTHNLLEAAEEFRSFDHFSVRHYPEARLAEARFLISSQAHKSGRKLLQDLIDSHRHLDYEARILLLESACEQNEEAEANYIYESLLGRYPKDQVAHRTWANYHLHFDKKDTESVVQSVLEDETDTEARRELQISLGTFLSRKGRYDESIELLRSVRQSLEHNFVEDDKDLDALIEEIEKRRDNPAYRRKQTLIKPLPLFLVYALYFLIIGAIIFVPAWSGIRHIYKGAQTNRLLEKRGLEAERALINSGIELDFNRTKITYSFYLSKEDPRSIETQSRIFGSTILFAGEAEKVLSSRNQYRILYLPDNPEVNDIYPFSDRAHVAGALEYAGGFVWLAILFAIALWMWVVARYKRYKFASLSKQRGSKKAPETAKFSPGV